MIEAVIAFGVLVAAILGPVTLVAFSLAQSKSSQNKLIAVNLGQEGIELIRTIRENNVICDRISSPPPVPWNNNPNGGSNLGQGASNLYTVDAGDTVTQTCGAASFPTPRPTADNDCSTRALNLTANGLYTYGAGAPTPYRRCVTVCVPASSAPCNGVADPDVGAASDQMEVISKVFWVDRGLERSVEFRERLYDWK